jgi:hypothetical protein
VHRIGVNVSQIARSLNAAVLQGKVSEFELAELSGLRRELRTHLLALRQAAFEGNLSYWDVEVRTTLGFCGDLSAPGASRRRGGGGDAPRFGGKRSLTSLLSAVLSVALHHPPRRG